MNIIDVFNSIIQHTAVAKIATEDYEVECSEATLDELKIEYRMAALSLISFVEKNSELLRLELLDGKEPPKLWTNVFIK